MSESRRISAIDTLRGFIMAVMAIDHVSGFVARRPLVAGPESPPKRVAWRLMYQAACREDPGNWAGRHG